MPKYLTVKQYKLRSAFPVANDSTLTDVALAYMIQQAETEVDAFMGFDLRLGGFEPHTGWVQEQWDARRLRVRIPNYPVPVRQALRYQIQVSNLTSSGAGFMAGINVNDIAYNLYDYYIEIVPLQSITYSLAPVLVQLGLRPPIVQWDYEAGFFLGATGERLIDSGDHTTYYALRGFWATTYTQAQSIRPLTLPPMPPVIYVNGGAVNSSTYTLDTVEGAVTFNTANASLDTVTADYTYTIPDAVRTAAIAQTTWLLGQRSLAARGMTGLEYLHLGDETMRRAKGEEQLTFLTKEAELALLPYIGVPVA